MATTAQEPIASQVGVDRVAVIPGLALVGAVAAVATAAGRLLPVVGAPVVGVVLGAALSARVRRRARLQPGVAFAARSVLQAAVVLLGAELSLGQVVAVGAASLPVMLGTLTVCLALALALGRRLGISPDLRTLIGVGTGICGASAIAAVSPAIRAKNPDIAYAISTIFIFNIAAVLTFPFVGHALHLSQHAFGLFAGTAVNDTSAVVAAAAAYGPVAAQHAVVVKLVRTLMIIPVTLVLSKGARAPKPWFLGAFLLVAAAHTLGLVPGELQPLLHRLAVFCIAVALAAVGLSTDVAALRRAGPRPLLLGLILWIAVGATSLGLQHLTGV